jgi:hypothetical protein
VPARVPSYQPPLGIVPEGQKEALRRSKAFLLRHAAISTVMALFLIGFNTAFTKGFIWFPWPVAALIVLWLYHLHKHLEIARGNNQGFSAWLDDGTMGSVIPRQPAAEGDEEEAPDAGFKTSPDQIALEFKSSSRRRKRDWLN